MNPRLSSVIAAAWLTAAMAFPAVSALSQEEEPAKAVVAAAFPNDQYFWLQCQEAMLNYAERNNLELNLVFSQNDQMKQNAQVRQLLASSPDVLILAAHDALGAASAVRRARSAKVKVLALDRLTLNADLDLYLAFDHEEAGLRQAEYLAGLAPEGPYVILSGPPNDYSSYLARKGAMKFLAPLIESGRIQVLADGPVLGGQAERARDLMRRLLTRNLLPAAVLAPNDAAAGGIVTALRESGISGLVPVAGQNGEPAAAHLIGTNEQAMTLIKDPAVLAVRALELAVSLARAENIETLTFIDNGRMEVPAVLLPAPLLDRRILETALKSKTFQPDGVQAGFL